jgi:ABC-2 type transport system permease protein
MFDIALHELRLIFMDRSIWLNLVVIPIVISFAVGLGNDAASGGGTDSGPLLRVDVLNSDAGAQGNALLERMRAANQNLILCPQDNTEDDACRLDGAALTTDLARERLTRETSLALLIIPEGFSARLDAGESSSLIYRSSDNAAAPGFILQALQAAAQQVGSAQTAARVGIEVAGNLDYLRFSDDADRDAFAAQIRDAATQAWETPPAQVALVTSQGETADGFSGFNQSVPGIASMYVMFAIFPAAAVLIRERKLGTFQRVLMMPVHRWQLLGGKMSARFVIGMIQYGIIFAFGLLLGVRFGGAPVALIVLMISFVLCITALTLMMTTFLKTEQQAQSMALFAGLTLAPLGGAWWPLSVVPEWMRVVGHISPVAWVMDGFNGLFYSAGAGFEAIVIPVAVLLGMTAVFFLIGVRRFRFV